MFGDEYCCLLSICDSLDLGWMIGWIFAVCFRSVIR